MILLDDNMYYHSMRYEYVQLARKCKNQYVVLVLHFRVIIMAIIIATVFFVLHIHVVYHFYTINYDDNQLGTSSGVN